VTAVWPAKDKAGSVSDAEKGTGAVNEAVIWDMIITAPSSDHLSTISPLAKKRLVKDSKGKSIDPSRYVLTSTQVPYVSNSLIDTY
jgi:signal peptidase complex subunit 3